MSSADEQHAMPSAEQQRRLAAKKRKRERQENGGQKIPKRQRSKPNSGAAVQEQNGPAAELTRSPNHSQSRAITVVRADDDEDGNAEETALVHSSEATWRIAEPVGGRIHADVEPIFSSDEKHIIITYESSIQVYSTQDSLLVRRIQLPQRSRKSTQAPHIAATVASLTDPSAVWVADSRQKIWKVDWTTGVCQAFAATRGQISTFVAARVGGKELLLTCEQISKSQYELVAYATGSDTKPSTRGLASLPGRLRILRTAAESSVVLGCAESDVVLASLTDGGKKQGVWAIDNLGCELYSFEAPDIVCALDARVAARRASSGKKAKHSSGAVGPPALDVVIGCARGAIYVYGNILAALAGAGSGSRERPQPRKYHWHPRAVHSVKWSADGEYFVSGGTENTLVLWQVDTGKTEVLPHLSGVIESIVVSPQGSLYALTLDDNSAMILSTSEMKPTAYVSGVQSLVLGQSRWKDTAVNRVWIPVDEISRPLTAAANPAATSRLYLCVGNGQMASATGAIPSASLLQTFDISSFQSLAKQPLARTNPTEASLTPKGFPVTEPWVSHISFSRGGDWLASVDEWQPPARDVESLVEDAHAAELLCSERKEVHLKFWKVGYQQLDLVSRIDESHSTAVRPESILDLASSPKSTLFGTVGADGCVRLWAPHIQKSSMTPAASKAALAVGSDANATDAVEGWSCVRAIALVSSSRIEMDGESLGPAPAPARPTGALAFSDDGSTLFVAYGPPDDLVLYIIDASSGEIRTRLHQLIDGEVRSLRVLGASVIILAGDNLVVYDVVEDRVRYGLSFEVPSSSPAALQLAQLAVDETSHTFAISVPVFTDPDAAPKCDSSVKSELAVFSPNSDQPLLIQSMHHLIISLLPVPGSSSFVAIDSAAQVSAIIQGTATNPLALPLSDLRLDKTTAEGDDADMMALDRNDDDDEGDQADGLLLDAGGDAMDEDADDDDLDSYGAIIAPEKLSHIFDAAPAFALPPIEDLFYQVTGLISGKPLASPAA
ncbi:hypothetical protein RB595_009609 [Gaeumannomyces hyphopodioides]